MTLGAALGLVWRGLPLRHFGLVGKVLCGCTTKSERGMTPCEWKKVGGGIPQVYSASNAQSRILVPEAQSGKL
jgi:hypothetical protein